MLAGEQHGNEQACDFVVPQVAPAVNMHVLALNEHLHPCTTCCQKQKRVARDTWVVRAPFVNLLLIMFVGQSWHRSSRSMSIYMSDQKASSGKHEYRPSTALEGIPVLGVGVEECNCSVQTHRNKS